MPIFKINADLSKIAEQLNTVKSEVEGFVMQKVEEISIATHTYILGKAQAELTGHQLDTYVGRAGSPNLKWEKISKGIWAVTLDPKAASIEEGGPGQFMQWLLDSPKAHTARDGSKFLAIPIKQSQKIGGKFNNSKPAYEAIAKSAIKDAGLSLNRLEKNPDGTPKSGVLHKMLIKEAPTGVTQSTHPGFFSAPRSKEMAALTGLPEHEGNYNLQGLAILQREVPVLNKATGEQLINRLTNQPKTKWTREAVVFRTISSKHKAEGRWFTKETKGLKAFPEAAEFAQRSLDDAIKELEQMLSRS